MKILVINCGSSSLKFQLIDSETEAVIAKGLCERIGIEGSKLIYTPTGGEKQEIEEKYGRSSFEPKDHNQSALDEFSILYL